MSSTISQSLSPSRVHTCKAGYINNFNIRYMLQFLKVLTTRG